MKTVTHYTSAAIWELITGARQTSFPEVVGKLLPRSNPNPFRAAELSDRVRQIITQHDSYLVCLTKREQWVEYGLWEHLVMQATLFSIDSVAIKVPILKQEGAFVRDHAFVSPKRFLTEYGVNLWPRVYVSAVTANDPTFEKDPRIQKAITEYMESTVPLKAYKNNYQIEEVWLPQTTPLARLQLGSL